MEDPRAVAEQQAERVQRHKIRRHHQDQQRGVRVQREHKVLESIAPLPHFEQSDEQCESRYHEDHQCLCLCGARLIKHRGVLRQRDMTLGDPLRDHVRRGRPLEDDETEGHVEGMDIRRHSDQEGRDADDYEELQWLGVSCPLPAHVSGCQVARPRDQRRQWFVGNNPDDAVWVPTVFTKNRDRLLEANIAEAFLQEVLKAADTRGLLSHEHFTVDGTLLEAAASQKSFRPKDDPSPPPSDGDPKNPTVNFRGEKRSNATHESVTDPDARLAKNSAGTTSVLAHLGSALMDNRHGLIVATDVRPPGYEAERDAAVEMLTTLEPRARRRTLGADKGYDTADFVEGVRACHTTPHVAQNIHATRPESAVDARTTRHAGYAVSQVKRKLVEECYGWGKTIGGLRKLQHRGREKVGWLFTFTFAAYDLVRIRTLIRAGVCA